MKPDLNQETFTEITESPDVRYDYFNVLQCEFPLFSGLEICNERKCRPELSVLSVKLPRFRGPKALTVSDGKKPFKHFKSLVLNF